MDVNATLSALRSLVGAINDGSHETVDAVDLANLCEGFDALDEWISNGGFLPAAWTKA